MKIIIGENIRKYRRKNDLTQEQLAEKLGVTYQSVSRWENATTYPDIEMLPAMAALFKTSVDELLGMPQEEKDNQARIAFKALQHECSEKDYDTDRIVSIVRDIRRNYLNNRFAYEFWQPCNRRAFSDPKILPEIRVTFEDYLKYQPTKFYAFEMMSVVEDEAHLDEFYDRYSPQNDISEHALRFKRYSIRHDEERFETERKYMFYASVNRLFVNDFYYLNEDKDADKAKEADLFRESLLELLTDHKNSNYPDIFVGDRIDIGIKCAAHLAENGNTKEALIKLESTVNLLEETMKIKEETVLPTSCRWLQGIDCRVKEDFGDMGYRQERGILVSVYFPKITPSYMVYPSECYELMSGTKFSSLIGLEHYMNLCERVQSMIIEA